MSNCHFYYWNNNLEFFHQISLCSQTTTPGMEAQRDLLHPAAQGPNHMHEAILFALFFSSCQTTGQKTPTRLHRVVNCKYDVTSFHHCFRNGLNSFNWFCSSNPRMYLVTCEAKKSKSGEGMEPKAPAALMTVNAKQSPGDLYQLVPNINTFVGSIWHPSVFQALTKILYLKMFSQFPRSIIVHQIRMSKSLCTDPTQSSKYWNTTCSTACNHHSCKTTVRHTRASTKKDVLTIRILTQKWIQQNENLHT